MVGVACAAVYRITFGDEDQPATTPKQRHRAEAPGATPDPADPPGVPAPAAGPDALVPAPDPTALDAAPAEFVPAVGMAAVEEALPAEPTVPVGPEVADALDAPPTVQLRPEPTQPLVPGELLRAEPTMAVPLDAAAANGNGTSAAAGGSDTVALHLPEPADGADGLVVFPTPGRNELIPGFGTTLLPWGPVPGDPAATPPAATPPATPAEDGDGDEPPAEDPPTEVVTTVDATMAVPVTAPPAATATSAATVDAPTSPATGTAATRTGQSTAAGTALRSRTVVVAPPSGARRIRSSITLVATMTMVGVLLAAAIGVAVLLLVYGLQTVITG